MFFERWEHLHLWAKIDFHNLRNNFLLPIHVLSTRSSNKWCGTKSVNWCCVQICRHTLRHMSSEISRFLPLCFHILQLVILSVAFLTTFIMIIYYGRRCKQNRLIENKMTSPIYGQDLATSDLVVQYRLQDIYLTKKGYHFTPEYVCTWLSSNLQEKTSLMILLINLKISRLELQLILKRLEGMFGLHNWIWKLEFNYQFQFSENYNSMSISV
jgi:hypothetical protein